MGGGGTFGLLGRDFEATLTAFETVIEMFYGAEAWNGVVEGSGEDSIGTERTKEEGRKERRLRRSCKADSCLGNHVT